MTIEDITLKVEIISAISGLVGVIVGGIITAGSNYLLYQKREKTERMRERDNHVIEIKRASRLIDEDLSWAEAAANYCVDKRLWWSTDAPKLTVEGWQQYRSIIAPELSSNAWSVVSVAVATVYQLNTSRDLYIELAKQTESDLTAITKELASIKTDIASKFKVTSEEEIESIQAKLAELMKNAEEQSTTILVNPNKITESTAELIVPMLNAIKAGRLALAPFVSNTAG